MKTKNIPNNCCEHKVTGYNLTISHRSDTDLFSNIYFLSLCFPFSAVCFYICLSAAESKIPSNEHKIHWSWKMSFSDILVIVIAISSENCATCPELSRCLTELTFTHEKMTAYLLIYFLPKEVSLEVNC